MTVIATVTAMTQKINPDKPCGYVGQYKLQGFFNERNLNKMNNKNIKIKIKYSVEFEVRRVLSTINKINWYQKNNYPVNLPKGIKLNHSQKITKKYIGEPIKREYKSKNYQRVGLFIKKEWNKIFPMITNNLLIIGLKLKPIYNIFLTKYGVGGSYFLPNNITLNFKTISKKRIITTIIHEIIHLLIEPLIQKYKIKHWHKERIVDLILIKIHPQLNKLQNIPLDTKKVDKIFNQFFPDIEEIIKKINKDL